MACASCCSAPCGALPAARLLGRAPPRTAPTPLHGVSARQSEAGQRAPGKVHHHSSVVNEFLKFRCRSVAVVEHEIGFPTQINGAQEYREFVGCQVRSCSPPSIVRLPGSGLCVPGRPRPDGGQPIPLDQRVQREGLVEFGRQLLRPCRIACPRQGQRRHCPHIAVRGQLQRRLGLGTRLLPVSRFHLAQRCRCLICCGVSLASLCWAESIARPVSSCAFFSLPYQPSVSACVASNWSSAPGLPMAAETNCAICAASPFKNANTVAVLEQELVLQLALLRLLVHRLRFIQPVEGRVGDAEVDIVGRIFGSRRSASRYSSNAFSQFPRRRKSIPAAVGSRLSGRSAATARRSAPPSPALPSQQCSSSPR